MQNAESSSGFLSPIPVTGGVAEGTGGGHVDRKSRPVRHPTCISRGAVIETSGTAWRLGVRGRGRARTSEGSHQEVDFSSLRGRTF